MSNSKRTPGDSARAASVGARIRARRLELGLSVRDLAGPGLSDSHISRIELGNRNPSGKALRALAHRLRISVHWLETGKEDPAEQLARLVLGLDGSVPPEATRLARTVLAATTPGI